MEVEAEVEVEVEVEVEAEVEVEVEAVVEEPRVLYVCRWSEVRRAASGSGRLCAAGCVHAVERRRAGGVHDSSPSAKDGAPRECHVL